MRLREIIEAAAWVSAHSQIFIEQPHRRDERQLTEFWLLSRQRLHDWTQAIDAHLLGRVAGRRLAGKRVARDGGNSLAGLMHEVLAAEVLARVWSATVTAAGRRSDSERYERLARHVFTGHLHARHRALSLIAEGRQFPAHELPQLDQLRRRCERWADVLVGHLVNLYEADEFAFDADRAREFGRTQEVRGVVSPRQPVWGLILAGIGVSFPERLTLPAQQGDRSRSIARAALTMFSDAEPASRAVPADSRSREQRSAFPARIGFAPTRQRPADEA